MSRETEVFAEDVVTILLEEASYQWGQICYLVNGVRPVREVVRIASASL